MTKRTEPVILTPKERLIVATLLLTILDDHTDAERALYNKVTGNEEDEDDDE